MVAAVAELVPPRIYHVPPFLSSRGQEAVEVAALAGLIADPHQALVLQGGCADLPNGKWANFEVAVCEPRQNGKNAILEMRELAGLFAWEEKLIIHSAHQFDTSDEHFRRLQYLIEDTPDFDHQVKRVSRAHGSEGIELKNGCRIRFRTRTKGGGRGFSCDTLILDEAMFLHESVHSALLPTLRARPNPQVWYAGSAVDQEIHEHGLVFTRVRNRALKGEGKSLAYFEWSLDYPNPSEIPEHVFHDEEARRKSNPAYGIRVGPEHFDIELGAMDRRGYAVEILGVGDWPDPSGSAEMPIAPEQWAACEDEDSKLLDPICLAFDVSPERRTSIAAAGKNQHGQWHVEVLEKLPGTNWLPGRLAELAVSHSPERVVCDALGPSGSLVQAVEEAGVVLQRVDRDEHTQACGRLVDAVSEGNLRHLGSLDLWNAIRGAKTRPLGDRWAWSRKSSSVDISPLVAATLALWGALGQRETDDEYWRIY